MLNALCNAFVSRTQHPTVPRMLRVYRLLRRDIPDLQKDAGAKTLFEARIFTELVVAARLLWEQQSG